MAMSDNLNAKRFGIMDAQGNHVAAGAGFAYRGFIISMTTIYNSPSVAVFAGELAEVVYDAVSVQDAINWCNLQADNN
jgi:hypothetical protein